MKKKESTKNLHKQIPGKENEVSPITLNEEIPQNPDPHIDQDFPGYPHPPAPKTIIHPKSPNEKLVAGTLKKSRGKNREKNSQDELDSDGSANAFERTELNEPPQKKKKPNSKNSSY